ncbi:condensation domain-containing protein [Amycolatopsis japonica]|uniref:condensation domain-containing protein n=1 Tax=Amycolatopsis japonica TaxID=208439 RepID=UPI00366E6BC4
MELLELTGAQQGIWLELADRPHSPAFNSAEYVELAGDLDIPAFLLAVDQMVEEADAMRLAFVRTPDGPRQQVCPPEGRSLGFVDLGGCADPHAEALSRMRADLHQRVDLVNGPLARQLLFRLGEQRFIWYQRVHTLLVDGFSLAKMTSRVTDKYVALTTGAEERAPAFLRLRGLLAGEEAYRSSDRFTTDRTFWTRRLAAQSRPFSLSTAWPSVASETFVRASVVLPAALMSLVRRAERALGAGWPVLFTGCAAAYLSAAREAEAVVLGLFAAGRYGTETANIPAMVSNVLPLHLVVGRTCTTERYVAQVLESMVRVLGHQRFRQEEMRHCREPVSAPLYGPLVNIMPFPREFEFAGVHGRTHNLSTGPIDDLMLAVWEVQDSSGETTLEVTVDTNPELYSQNETTGHAEGIAAFLEAFVNAGSSARLSDVLGTVV